MKINKCKLVSDVLNNKKCVHLSQPLQDREIDGNGEHQFISEFVLFTCNYEHKDEFAHMSQLHDNRRCNQYQNGVIAEVRWEKRTNGRCKM